MGLNFAGFWRRFSALVIDGLIIWLLCMITIIPYWIPPLAVVIAAYYRVVFETSELKGTPGKVLMNIAVTKSDGSPLTIKDSIVRFAISFISSAICLAGYIMSLLTQKRQTLHDLVADTIVINKRIDNVNYIEIFLSQTKKIFNRKSEEQVTATDLEELYQLYQKGIITEAEYSAKKESYLKRL